MNSMMLSANIVGDVKMSETKDGAAKALFRISPDGRDMPLHIQCVVFGTAAQIAAGIFDGDLVMISGRLVENTATRGVSLVVHGIEILSGSQAEVEFGSKLVQSAVTL
jgi:single-stranded DNA-binding protein